jgi:hypothetical protein
MCSVSRTFILFLFTFHFKEGATWLTVILWDGLDVTKLHFISLCVKILILVCLREGIIKYAYVFYLDKIIVCVMSSLSPHPPICIIYPKSRFVGWKSHLTSPDLVFSLIYNTVISEKVNLWTLFILRCLAFPGL